MPKKLEDCVRDVKAQGKDSDSAWPICVDSTGEKPHKETAEETMMREVLDAKCDGSGGGNCGCQSKKKTY